MKKFILFLATILIAGLTLSAQQVEDSTVTDVMDTTTTTIVEDVATVMSSSADTMNIAFLALAAFFSLITMAGTLMFCKTYKFTSYWDEIKGHSKVNMYLSILTCILVIVSLLLT